MRASDKLQVKAEILNAFFASVFTGRTFLWVPQVSEPVGMKQYPQYRKKSKRSLKLLGCIVVHGVR